MNAIEVDGITKFIGERKILDEVSFTVKRSRIHGFLGPNGAGKTTTMRILCGLMQASSGEVRIDGICNNRLDKSLYQKIGFLIEEPPLYGDMKVWEYLRFVACLRRVSEKNIKDHIEYCLNVLDLESVKERSIENLSRGYKQRVGIAQAIIHRPDIVFLDEPNLGLDPKSIREIRDLISQLKENHTIILSSHLLHEMSLVCDDITIISKGRVVESGDLHQLKASLEASQSFILSVVEENKAFEKFLENDANISKFGVLKQNDHVDYHITLRTNNEFRPFVVQRAIESSVEVLSLEKKHFDLESYFLKVTQSHD